MIHYKSFSATYMVYYKSFSTTYMVYHKSSSTTYTVYYKSFLTTYIWYTISHLRQCIWYTISHFQQCIWYNMSNLQQRIWWTISVHILDLGSPLCIDFKFLDFNAEDRVVSIDRVSNEWQYRNNSNLIHGHVKMENLLPITITLHSLEF